MNYTINKAHPLIAIESVGQGRVIMWGANLHMELYQVTEEKNREAVRCVNVRNGVLVWLSREAKVTPMKQTANAVFEVDA